jgi:nucleotidyltransferase/DNA polymerase involved in DNA repair
MEPPPLTLTSLSRAIVHIDGDAFFAACEQSRRPKLQGRPVVTGKERGIAASMSYEAKALGVTRGMRLSEIRKLCPDVVILPSDYETYSLLSKRFFDIVRRYTPDVEEYSIDECFADLTGLRRPLRLSYAGMAARIKEDLDRELGFTFSVGLAPTKVVAKIASKWQKPSGLTVIPGKELHRFLAAVPVDKVWGIGRQTTALLAKHGVKTALDLARRPEEWVTKRFTKPVVAIRQELNGHAVLPVETQPKETYASIQKVKTFTPPSSDREMVYAQLAKNIESACTKARRYKLAAQRALIFLRTQDFKDLGREVELSRPTCFPSDLLRAVAPAFDAVFAAGTSYRATGVILHHFSEEYYGQLDLFGEVVRLQRLSNLYESVDALSAKYGKHTLFLRASLPAHLHARHAGDRGELPERHLSLLPGETPRKRLGIPFFMGEVK